MVEVAVMGKPSRKDDVFTIAVFVVVGFMFLGLVVTSLR